MVSLDPCRFSVSMKPSAIWTGLTMPTFKAINIEFPDTDSTTTVSQETYVEALARLGMTENELIQRSLAHFINANRDDSGRIHNYALSQDVLKNHKGNLSGLKALAQEFLPEGEQTCKSRSEASSAAGSPKRG